MAYNNGVTLQMHNASNREFISLQHARFIDNVSVDNVGTLAHDCGYGTALSPVDVVDGESWLSNSGKVGIYRHVNADGISTAREEGFDKVSQLCNKYNFLPRENVDRCGSPMSLKQDDVATANSAGVLMTPLHENDEKSHEQRLQRTTKKFTSESVSTTEQQQQQQCLLK